MAGCAVLSWSYITNVLNWGIIFQTFFDLRGSFTQGGGGGGHPYESDGDVSQKIKIKTPRETNVGVAQAYTEP